MSRLSKGLLVAQVAVSALLLVGAGLFIRTLYNLQRINLGFNQNNLLIFTVQPGSAGYKDEQLVRFYQQLSDRLDNLPGVRSATFAQIALIANDNWFGDFRLPGEVEGSAPERGTWRQRIRENYFATLEIPLLRGRVFTRQDDRHAPCVAIINQKFQEKFFPNEDVIGKHVTLDNKHDVEIVGLVANAKYQSQREETEPLLFTPWEQEIDEIGTMHFALRTQNDPALLGTQVREVVHQLDSSLPVTNVSTQLERSQITLAQERLYAQLFSFFGAVALALAGIGLFGVLAYSVSQRTREIGIRMAFGARVSNVLLMVIWQGMKLVVLGLAISTLIGYALVRLLNRQYFGPDSWQQRMREQLYGVTLGDPLTLIAIAFLLWLVALAACWLPARRAAKVDPLVALRYE